MPFGAYDRENRLIRVYKRHGVNHVILLVTDEEIETKARKDLREIYAANSMSFTQFPFRDFHAPSLTKATPNRSSVCSTNENVTLMGIHTST